MAKRKREVVVRSIVGNLYEAWIDDDDVDKVRAMPAIQEVYERGSCGAPWGIKLDPRYDAAEVIAEIEALGEPEKPKRAAWERAYGLGKEAGASGCVVEVALDYLKGAEQTYSEPDRYKQVLFTLQSSIIHRLQYGRW